MPIPDQTVIVDALIEELEMLGGAADPQELIDRLADRFQLTDAERQETSQSGRRAFDHRVYQAAYMARSKRGVMESLKKSGRGIWALMDKSKIKRKKAPAPRAAAPAAPRQQERVTQIKPYESAYERPADKSREELRSRLDYFASIFKEEREHKTFEPSRELQNEMNALRSTLENTIAQLERVGEYLVREVQVVKQESAESPLDDKELISGVGDIGALFAQQVDKVRSTIKSTLGLPVLRPGLLTAYIELLVKSI